MTTYVLNSPVLSDYGHWHFRGPVSVDEARGVLAKGFISAIGHDAAALFLSDRLGVNVAMNRIRIQMLPGDRALVLRLNGRLPAVMDLDDAAMTALPFELGILERLD